MRPRVGGCKAGNHDNDLELASIGRGFGLASGSGKERGPGAARGGAQDRKAHSVQGKHHAGAKVLRQARADHAGAGFKTATCGLETRSGEAHEQQRRDQRRLAADAVAVVAEDRSAHRPRDEAHEAGDGAVEKKIVPLDGDADGRGDDGAAQLRLMF
jgi:hypothetical protein